jgi:type IV pilus assembly protein PilY1
MKRILMVLGIWLVSVGAQASGELELYKGESKDIPARLMLLIDTSISMGSKLCADDTPGCAPKLDILKATLARFLDPNGENANIRWADDVEVGLARYNSPGATILAEIKPLGSTEGGVSHRQRLATLVGGLEANDITPLVGSYLETIEYLMGGRAISSGSVGSGLSSAWANAPAYRYSVGMNQSLICGRSNNHLVVLTDGASNGEEMDQRIVGCSGWGGSCSTTIGQRIQQRFNNSASDAYLDECPSTIKTSLSSSNPSNALIWGCASALAKSIVNTADPDNISGIRTHTIAYDLGSGSSCTAKVDNPTSAVHHLCNWAKDGGGNSYVANDSAALENAFSTLTGEVTMSASFTAVVPGVSVNQASRFSFLDDIYYSVFKPTDRQVWYGNLKKYQLDRVNGEPVIKGGNDQLIDSNKDGFFDSDAVSFWFNSSDYSPAILADGDNVILGGAALRIPPKASRKLYTSLDNSSTIEVGADAASVASVVNAMLPANIPDVETEAEMRTKLQGVVDWLQGDDALDSNNEWDRLTAAQHSAQDPKLNRTLYGAPIHSSPVVVNYQSTQVVSNVRVPLAPADQTNLVFVSTNDGKLYAVNSETGNEKLAFVPGALLRRPTDTTPSMIEAYHDAARGNLAGDFIYGLDSTWTVWRQDVNGDGNITPELSGSKDFVYLYGGMRRGGRNYYGLDVTEANDSTPKMEQMFVLEGGKSGTETATMGQTWSEPVLGMIRYNGVPVVVFIVGGGYDPVYDVSTPASGTTPLGAHLFIVAAHSRSGTTIKAGDVLWWASEDLSGTGNHKSVSALTDSIPSAVKVLDRDGDGYLDHIYVADLGGTLMRFDINDSNTGYDNLISNTNNVVVAELGADAASPLDDADRRFFYPPSIALMKDNLGKHVAIAIGSGLVTDPKDESADERFFFIKDYAPFGATVAPENNPIYSYELELDAEKLLGSPLIVGGMAFFSTYYWGDNTPAAGASACDSIYGRAALYRYDPSNGVMTQLGKAFPQSLAGNMATVLQPVPEERNPDGTLRTPAGTDFIGIGGTSAFDLPDVDLGNIRKTRWKQCADLACE